MDLRKLKNHYFFLGGIYGILIWNSILNGNDFFVQSYQNPNISQEYTFYWFILVMAGLPLNIYLEQYFSIFLISDASSWLFLLSTDILYLLSVTLSPGSFKNFCFAVNIMILSIFSALVNLTSQAICSRFRQEDQVISSTGKAFSGLTANLFMIISLLATGGKNDSLRLYKISNIITNVFAVFFLLVYQRKFYAHCQQNDYQKLMNQSSFSMELIEKVEPGAICDDNQDQKLNFDANTISYTALFRLKLLPLFGLFLNFFHTLLIYPVLVFRLPLAINEQYKYLYISLLFNVGDYLGRHYYPRLALYIGHSHGHWLNLFKCLLTFYNLYVLSSPSSFFSNFLFQSLYVLLFSSLNGFLLLVFIEYARVGLKSIYDKQRAGTLIGIAIQVGLTIGGISSKLW